MKFKSTFRTSQGLEQLHFFIFFMGMIWCLIYGLNLGVMMFSQNKNSCFIALSFEVVLIWSLCLLINTTLNCYNLTSRTSKVNCSKEVLIEWPDVKVSYHYSNVYMLILAAFWNVFLVSFKLAMCFICFVSCIYFVCAYQEMRLPPSFRPIYDHLFESPFPYN